MKKILAISSGGGHWVQLLRLRPAFEGCHVEYATVNGAYRSEVAGAPFHLINDATRWDKVGLVRMAMKIAWILLRVQPDVIVTTGAAPGYFALRLGRMMGARTIWLDSVANVERLSLSGEKAGRFADLWLTQWPHLASDQGGTALRAVEEGVGGTALRAVDDEGGDHSSESCATSDHSSESCATSDHSSKSCATRDRKGPVYCGSVL